MALGGKTGNNLMADQSDVETTLVNLVVGALYPNGTDVPGVTSAICKVYRGWPASSALDQDLANGVINVTVFPAGEPGHNTTRYAPRWIQGIQQVTLSVSVVDTSVTFQGVADAQQLAGVLVDKVPYVYVVQATDTPQTIAANLAALIRADWIVNLSGATLVIPGASLIEARTAAAATATQEARRQRQCFRITCWCPDPGSRDTCAAAVDQFMAGLAFISLPDSTQGHLRYRGTLVFDQSQDALLYRRDLLYDIEYATIVTSTLPSMLFGQLVLNANSIVV